MLDTGSVFDVMASDDADRRTAQRKALALSQARLDNTMGRFLRSAVTTEEFQARMAAVQEDFSRHVAEASAEVGYDQPERLIPILASHYERNRKWQPVHAFGTPSVHYDGPAYPPEGMDLGPGAPELNAEGQPVDLQRTGPFNWNTATPEEQHQQYLDLDQAYGTMPGSPLHHDSRCPLCAQGGRVAQDIGEKVDTGEMQDSNDGKGINEPHQDDEDADAPKVKSSSVKQADGNTDLGGPEPKMDKRLWEPSNLGDPEVADGRWPTERKDMTEPIGPPNNEHPLSEIGEKFTETVSLPNNTGDAGYDAGGPGPAPHTDTFGGDGQATPVTHETQPE